VRHVPTVAGRELRSLFVSPVAYGVLSLFAVLAGVFFILNVAEFSNYVFQLQQFQRFEQLETLNLNDHLIAYFYSSMSIVLLFLVPGITMGLYAAEKTNGTQELLLTSPLTMWDIVLGKFLAGMAFVTLLVVIVGLYPLILFLYGDPEVGKTASGLLGLLLTGWVYVAVGTFASSVTRSQVIAFLLAFFVLLALLLLPAIASMPMASAGLRPFFEWLSTGVHLEEMVKGLVDTADVAYFLVVIGAFLTLTKASVESVRWR